MVKVLDFGVAKFSSWNEMPSSARKDVTQVGIIVGTPGYMAPEQALGSGANERSDLYALGVILWEAMAGRVLWSAPDLQRLVEKQLMTNPPRLRVVRRDADIPPELDELVASLLARRVEDRPVDAAAVRDRLRGLLKTDTGSHQRWSTGALPPPGASQSRPPQRMVSSRPPSRRQRAVPRLAWLVTALLAAILVGVGALVATGRLELRARGDIAAMANQVAERFNLPLAAEPISKSGLPAQLDASFARMVAAEERDERRAAANAILSHAPPDDVPSYARHMAYLQLAKSCHQKRLEVVRLADLGDPRALPLLLRLSARPRMGCGRKRREDCLSCLRDELASAITRLEERRSAAAARAPAGD
jgi:serine/threonine-protein kinase